MSTRREGGEGVGIRAGRRSPSRARRTDDEAAVREAMRPLRAAETPTHAPRASIRSRKAPACASRATPRGQPTEVVAGGRRACGEEEAARRHTAREGLGAQRAVGVRDGSVRERAGSRGSQSGTPPARRARRATGRGGRVELVEPIEAAREPRRRERQPVGWRPLLCGGGRGGGALGGGGGGGSVGGQARADEVGVWHQERRLGPAARLQRREHDTVGDGVLDEARLHRAVEVAQPRRVHRRRRALPRQ